MKHLNNYQDHINEAFKFLSNEKIEDAVKRSDLKLIDSLINELDRDTTYDNKKLHYFLTLASMDNNITVARHLLDNHDIDLEYGGAVAVRNAFTKGHMDLMNMLFDHNAMEVIAGLIESINFSKEATNAEELMIEIVVATGKVEYIKELMMEDFDISVVNVNNGLRRNKDNSEEVFSFFVDEVYNEDIAKLSGMVPTSINLNKPEWTQRLAAKGAKFPHYDHLYYQSVFYNEQVNMAAIKLYLDSIKRNNKISVPKPAENRNGFGVNDLFDWMRKHIDSNKDLTTQTEVVNLIIDYVEEIVIKYPNLFKDHSATEILRDVIYKMPSNTGQRLARIAGYSSTNDFTLHMIDNLMRAKPFSVDVVSSGPGHYADESHHEQYRSVEALYRYMVQWAESDSPVKEQVISKLIAMLVLLIPDMQPSFLEHKSSRFLKSIITKLPIKNQQEIANLAGLDDAEELIGVIEMS